MSPAPFSTSPVAGSDAVDYHFQRQGRSATAAVVLILIWLTLLSLYLFLEASVWVVAGLCLFTLPAAYDFSRNPASGLSLTAEALEWHSGARSGRVEHDEIDRIRLDTRLDLSIRVSVILKSGRRIRLPFESTPPHLAFEAALKEHGIPTERFHFQLMQ